MNSQFSRKFPCPPATTSLSRADAGAVSGQSPIDEDKTPAEVAELVADLGLGHVWDDFKNSRGVLASKDCSTLCRAFVVAGATSALEEVFRRHYRGNNTCLDLSGEHLGGENPGAALAHMKTICRALRKLPGDARPFHLDLADNYFNDDDVTILAECLSASPLIGLRLSGCDIGWSAVQSLARALPSSRLTWLDLSELPIDPDLVTRLHTAAPPGALVLTGDSTRVSERLAIANGDALSIHVALASAADVQLLQESYRSEGSVKALAWLVHEAARTCCPWWFSLDGQMLDRSAVEDLGQCLELLPASCPQFRLSLMDCGLDASSALHIVQSLKGHAVEWLDLSGNQIDDDGWIALCEILARGEGPVGLVRLDVGNKPLTFPAYLALAGLEERQLVSYIGGIHQVDPMTGVPQIWPDPPQTREALATWAAFRDCIRPARTVSRSHLLQSEPPSEQPVRTSLRTFISLDLATWVLHHGMVLKAVNQRFSRIEDHFTSNQRIWDRFANDAVANIDLADVARTLADDPYGTCDWLGNWAFGVLSEMIRELSEVHPELRPFLPEVILAADWTAGTRPGGVAGQGHTFALLACSPDPCEWIVVDPWVLLACVASLRETEYRISHVMDRTRPGQQTTSGTRRPVDPEILEALTPLARQDGSTEVLGTVQYMNPARYDDSVYPLWNVTRLEKPGVRPTRFICGPDEAPMELDTDQVSENFRVRLVRAQEADFVLTATGSPGLGETPSWRELPPDHPFKNPPYMAKE